MIYFDHNATTAVSDSVLQAMLPWFRDQFGNASSAHAMGRTAYMAVESARAKIATAIGASPSEIVFTSGATESTNIAIRGTAGKVVTSTIEHKSVLDTVESHCASSATVEVDTCGRINTTEISEAAPGASLVSVILANNETGVVQDLDTIVKIAMEHGCLVHSDATQALGKIPLNVRVMGLDLASFSGHKIQGPKGIGFLYVRRGLQLAPVVTGGGHERGLRSGTLNVPSIVGLGVAVENAVETQEMTARKCRALISELVQALEPAKPFTIYSDSETGLPNTLSIRFIGADGEAVMAHAPEVAMSVGSACSSSIPTPSHVLMAMGLTKNAAEETLRISLGSSNTSQEVQSAASQIVKAVQTVRDLSGNSSSTYALSAGEIQ